MLSVSILLVSKAILTLWFKECIRIKKTFAFYWSLNPYPLVENILKAEHSSVSKENLPLGAVPLFATGSPKYNHFLSIVVSRINSVYTEFLRSDEGTFFNGQVNG